jgi:hypothetical protein
MKNIHISPVDTNFVNGNYPIEFLFYYSKKISGKAIRKALKLCSQSFWPLFGRYENGRIYSEKYKETDFFNELELNENFDQTADDIDLWKKYQTINPHPMERLFSLSVLQFKNGTVFIPKMNHLAGDGYSYFYFLGVLAALTQNSFIPFRRTLLRIASAPHHNRTALKPFLFEKTEIAPALRYDNCSIHHETVSRKSIREQLRKIGSEKKETVSTNDILSAMVVKKTIKSQPDKFENKLTLSIPVDVRHRVKEYGTKFFGNGLYFHHLNIEFTKSEQPDVDELAIMIRDSMPQISKNFYEEYLDKLEAYIAGSDVHALNPYNPEKGCLVTNLSRLPSKTLNFGTGNPDFIFILTIGMNSAVILADSENFILRLVY